MKDAGTIASVGGALGLSQLTNQVVGTHAIEQHCRKVAEKYLSRELIRIGGYISSIGFAEDEDIFERLDAAEKELFSITSGTFKRDYVQIGTRLPQLFKTMEEAQRRGDTITGVPSGFAALDRCTIGWQPTDLIVLAARPSVGKTAFALNLARNAVVDPSHPVAVGIFSLEMSTDQLLKRMLSADSQVELNDINRGIIGGNQQRLEQSASRLHQYPIYVDDTPALSILELRSKSRRMVDKHRVGLIIIDYMQLMAGDLRRNQNREQEIAQISRSLKQLAKELQVPVIALSQLSRDVEKRTDKTPKLSDLRESGAIEQDADVVMFLYRQDNRKDRGALIISKHRNGSLEEFTFDVSHHVQRWHNCEKIEWDHEPYKQNSQVDEKIF